jgi:hypothetical protein
MHTPRYLPNGNARSLYFAKFGDNNYSKKGTKDDTPFFEKSHHGILDLLVFY